MQRSLSLTLVAIVLVVSPRLSSAQVRFFAGKRSAEPSRPAPAPEPPPQPVKVWWTTEPIKGEGLTKREAVDKAMQNAREEVIDFLAQKHPDIDWQPNAHYLEKTAMVTLKGEPTKALARVKKEDGTISEYEYYKASVNVVVTDQNVAEMREYSRQERVRKRHYLAALALVGVMIVLVVLAGYLRLEEMTRGFYTGLLRFSAVTLLVLTGAGLWLLQ